MSYPQRSREACDTLQKYA